ncbi:sn-glycerol-3-phosphate ABC transporter permease UgpE [Radicibacter daui]|uniref:sn-glycerol-3-phosphate ABC transporter permease UgpE n=1 Tax=Radicibacter daui TaxID=3064829 RepID=UPI004046B3AE
MIETRQTGRLIAHFLLIVAVIAMGFPLYYTFIASTHTSSEILSPPLSMLPGSNIAGAYGLALTKGASSAGNVSMTLMLWNSLVMALAIAIGKIVISMLSAYAIVFFRFPLRLVCFWMIFITLMLPVEVRIVPTYQVIVSLGLLDTYAGLTVPLMASATATFLFRQFFLTIPDELVEAARLDGAGAMRFFKDILLPLSRTNIAALFVVTFIYGWTQYLWPLLVTTDPAMGTIIVALKKMVNFSDADTPWDAVMATAILALLPPVAVIVGMQKLFVKGLVETEK